MTDELPPSISELLAHRPFLERLALHLTGERGSADDLVQETWLKVLERPPRHGSNPTAWLERVMRSLHYRRKHRDALLKTSELDPVLPADEGSPEELAERSEVWQQAAEVTSRLKEPYRSVVLLRLYKGKTPTEIAAQLGRPVNTVTSQLDRGMHQIRSELDRRYAGDRSRWSRAFLPILAGSLRRTQEKGQARGATRTGAARRLALSAQMLLAIGAAAVLVSVLVSVWPQASDGPLLADRGTPAGAKGPPTAELAVEAAQSAARTEKPPAPPPAPVEASPPDEPRIEVEVVNSGGAPLEDVSLYASNPSADRAPGDLMSEEGAGLFMIWRPVAHTDAQGRARIVVSGSWTGPGNDGKTYVGLMASKPGFVRSPVHYVLCPPHLDAPLRMTLASPALSFRGRVTDAEGAPLSRVWALVGPEDHVWVPTGPVNVAERTMGRFTDARGAFQLDDLVPGDQRLILRANEFVPLVQQVDGSELALEHTFVLQRGATLYGYVSTEKGETVAGAEIIARYSIPRIRPVMQGVLSEADGSFELGGLAPQVVHLLARDPDDHDLFDSVFLTVSGSEVEWLPVLARRPHLRLKIVTDDGDPLARAGFKLYREPGSAWSIDLATDDKGLLSVRGLPVASYRADVYRSLEELQHGFPARSARHEVESGKENVLVVPRARLADAHVQGRILAGAGVRLQMAKVYLRPLESEISTSISVDPGTGRFSRGPIAPQPYSVTLFLEGLGARFLGEFEARADETHDLGDIVLPELATLNVDWRWPGEDSQYSYRLEQVLMDGLRPAKWVTCTGQGQPPGPMQVLPGRFEWSVSKGGKQVDHPEFEVQPSSSFQLVTGTKTR